MDGSNSPSSSGSLRSAAYRASVSGEGLLVLAITTSTGRPIVRDTHDAASAAVNFSIPLPSESRLEIRMIGPRISASASLTPRTSSGGMRLVKKLPGPMITASNARIASATTG